MLTCHQHGRSFVGVAPTKQRGDQAELAVAADLAARGYRVLFPFGEDCSYDLAIDDGTSFARIQVKFVSAKKNVLVVPCRTNSLTNGKVRHIKHYTASMIDWLAAFEPVSGDCFYIPASELGDGRWGISLRLGPAANNQKRGVRMASDYADLVLPTPN